ncbi:hypothetical protein [Streptomyces subrutilus]|uniref:hypothetical protein n=1 Tax=Streptomyces subrutilus TaxID=36818 RepID=UPI003402829A
MTHPTDGEALKARMAAHIDAALFLLDEIQDPLARERATRLLADDLLPDAVSRVKAARGAAVRELRETRGLKLREIAELLELTTGRVDQLLKGK